MNIAHAVVCACVPLRTAASVHIAKWSPDGEYVATVGKVHSRKHVAKQQMLINCNCMVCGDVFI